MPARARGEAHNDGGGNGRAAAPRQRMRRTQTARRRMRAAQEGSSGEEEEHGGRCKSKMQENGEGAEASCWVAPRVKKRQGHG